MLGIKRVEMAVAQRDFGMRHSVYAGGNIYFVYLFTRVSFITFKFIA